MVSTLDLIVMTSGGREDAMSGARGAANIPHCTGQPHNNKRAGPNCQMVLRLRNPGPPCQ